MKKLIFSIWIACFVATQLFAQTGSSCTEPNIITSIPYLQQGLTTVGLFNNYTTSPCGNTYMSGNDYIFTYTPTSDLNIKITLTNTAPYGVGVFVLDACPNDANAHCIAYNEGQNGNPSIPNAPLIANTTYYIVVSTYNLFNLNLTTSFDIDITQLFSYDAGVRFLNAPWTNCGLGQNEYLNVNLRNFGANPISDFDMAFRINDGPEQITHCFDTIPSNDGIYFTYNIPVDLSTYGATYKIQCYPKLANDLNHSNDTSLDYRTNSVVVSTFPYTEDFENGPGGWVTEWRDDSYPTAWQLGTPNDTALDHAASGLKAWKTNLSGFYNPWEFSYILSPCFNLSTITVPWIEFNIWYELNSLDIVGLQASTDNGAHWVTIGNPNEGTNWYNNPQGSTTNGWYGFSGNWLNAKHALEGMGGKSHVQLRFLITAGSANVNEGAAIDNIKIYEAPLKNLGVVAISSPTSNCGLSSTENITIKIVNFGLEPQINFNVAYIINNTTWLSELVTDSIYPGDTLNYTFTHQANVSTSGNILITARTELLNDYDTVNDSLTVSIYNFQNQSNYPYAQNFETNDGGWVRTGLNPSWEYGQITDTVITHASSGTHAWKTNLDGTCNEAENSFLTGPCFDLTGLLNPYVKFNVWYETQGMGTQFESTTDGLNWLNLGASTDPHWYNQGHNFIEHGGNWIPVWHSLRDFIGQAHIQFRFEFQSLVKISGFAFDDFSICDAPIAQFTYTTNWPQVAFDGSSNGATTWHWDFGDGDTSIVRNPLHSFISDTNIVTLIIGNNCNTDTIVKTIIHCAPIANFTYTMTGSQVIFQSTTTNATSTLWDFGDGGISNLTNPTHNFTNDSNYVTMITANSCGSDTMIVLITNTGIVEQLIQQIKIYPNPAHQELFIEMPNIADATTLSIINSQGKTVLHKKLSSDKIQNKINIADITKGIYLIQVKAKQFIMNKKISIQ